MKVKRLWPVLFSLSLLVGLGGYLLLEEYSRRPNVSFTSAPDIFNWDIKNPEKGWEDAIDWFLKNLKKDGPDFTLHAGDVMDARWWDSESQIIQNTEVYWKGFINRFKKHGIKIILRLAITNMAMIRV